MLNYARQRAVEALKIPRTAVLATSGPAGVQAGEFPCEAVGLDLYLLVPRTSDHLFNLEENPAVSLLSKAWELKGEAEILYSCPPGLELALLEEPGDHRVKAEWYVLIRIAPGQFHIHREVIQPEEQWGNLETIDLKPG